MRLFLLLITPLLFAASCSSTSFNNGVFQKRKYNSGFYFNKKQNIQTKHNGETSITEKQPVKVTVEKDTPPSTFSIKKDKSNLTSAEAKPDSVRIVLKNGDVYVGLQIEDTETGVVIQLNAERTVYLRKENIEIISILSSSSDLSIVSESSEKVSPTIDEDYVSDHKNNFNPAYTKLIEAKNLYKKAAGHTIKSIIALGILIISLALIIGAGSGFSIFLPVPAMLFLIAIAIASIAFLFYHYIKMFQYLDRTLEKITSHRKENLAKPNGNNLLILTWVHLLLASSFLGLMFWIPIVFILLHKYY